MLLLLNFFYLNFIFLGEYVVKKLAEPYLKTGRNITTDQFFTSYKLAIFLLSKQTTIVGTVNVNKREVSSFNKTKLELHDSKFYENKNGVLLTEYQCKEKKKVFLISTRHEHAQIAPDKSKNPNRQKKKPTTIVYYNKTKCGVDAVDHMSKDYSVKYASRRWPVQVWSNILNLAGINSWILYKEAHNSSISRKNFLIKLIKEIAALVSGDDDDLENGQTDLQETPRTPTTPRFGTKRLAEYVVGNARKRIRMDEIPDYSPKMKQCQTRCCNNNKAIMTCCSCDKSICGKCTFTKLYICKLCQKIEDDK